jgi:hypothetical protein
VLLDLGPDVDPRAAIGDKGYDSNASRLAEQNQIGRIDTGALRTTAPAMLRYDQFLVGCRTAARSSLSMP